MNRVIQVKLNSSQCANAVSYAFADHRNNSASRAYLISEGESGFCEVDPVVIFYHPDVNGHLLVSGSKNAIDVEIHRDSVELGKTTFKGKVRDASICADFIEIMNGLVLVSPFSVELFGKSK